MTLQIFLTIIAGFSALGLFLNVLLMPIILTKSPSIRGKYVALLISYRVTSTIICFAQMCSYPMVLILNHGVLIVNFTTVFAEFFFIHIHSSAYLCLALLATISLFYRVLFITVKQKKLFSTIGTTLIVSLVILIGISWALFHNALSPEEQFLLDVEESVFNITGMEIDNLAKIGGEYFHAKGGWGNGLKLSLAYSVFLGLCFFISAGCICAFARKWETNAWSVTKYLQQRLFFLLVLQIFMPFAICSIFAGGAYAFASVKGIQPTSFPFWFMAFLPLAQFVDPILSFWMVKDYRIRISLPRSAPKVAPVTAMEMAPTRG